MRYVGDIISEIRELTSNEDYGDQEGVSQKEILSYANYAQDMLQGAILRNVAACDLFDLTVTLQTASRTRTVSLPGDSSYAGSDLPVYGASAVKLVEYSYTSSTDDYKRLRRKTLGELSVAESDPVNEYAILGRTLVLGPTPISDGKLIRVTYVSILPRLSLRMGKIQSATASSITLASSPTPESELGIITAPYYVSIVGGLGARVQYSVLVTAYDSGTRVLTIDSSTPVLNPSTLANYWIASGQYATTHPQVIPPEFVERYMVAFAAMKLFNKDSSKDAKWATEEMNQIERDVTGNLISITKDAQELPILDWSWLAA